MIQVVTIKNPFENKKDVQEMYWTRREIPTYINVAGMDVFMDGHLIEHPESVIPADGSQIICTPHIAGKGLKRFLGFAAMIALTVYAGSVGGGLWAKAGSFFAKGAIGATLASGAVMFLGGKLINAIFPQDISTPKWNDTESSQSYGWDLPTPSTIAGNCVGETYGECIPQAQLLEQHVETVNNKQYLNLLYCGGYGPIDSIDKIRIDYTDISNFSGVQLETRLGTNNQKPISFFHTTPLDQSVCLELDVNSPLVRTSDSALASSLEVTLEWPAGLYHINDDSGYGNATTKFRIEYRKNGADKWTLDKDYTETAATNEALRKSYQINGLEEGRYDVRVTLLSKPSSSRDQAMVQWTMLTSYNNGVYSRPGKVLVAMRILATNQLSSGVPSVSWRQKRSHVWVYNPHKNEYEQQAANNPIWAAYDIMHQCRQMENINTGNLEFVHYGCQHEDLDAYYDEWVDAADYAFEMITNQDGEKEHRYEFDAYFDTAQKRITAAQKAAAVGHAVIIAHGRNYGIVVDRPGHISQIFGEGRTTVSSIKGSFTSKEDRARAVDVTYSDEHNDFKNTMMTVRSPAYSKDDGVDNTTQLTLFGVKRRSQAYREAVTALATSERQLQFVELQTDIDGIVAEYGDIVGYNHKVSHIGIASGRIVSAEASKLTLDKHVDMAPSKSYEIYITLKNDTIIKRDVVSVKDNVSTDAISVTEPFDDGQIPERFDNYAFGECDKAIKPFRIVSASKDGDMLVSLKLAEYDEAMYATELDYSKYPVIDYSSEPTVATLKDIRAREHSYTIGTSAMSDIIVEWDLTTTGELPSNYIVEAVSRNSSFVESMSTRQTSCLFHGVRTGETYDITVRCVYDAMSVGSMTTNIYVSGIDAPADNIDNLIALRVAGGFRLTWSPSRQKDLAGYSVYVSRDTDDLTKAACVSAKQTDTTFFYAADTAGTYYFWVTAVNASGEKIGSTLHTAAILTLPLAVKDASVRAQYRQYADGSTGYDLIVKYKLQDNPYGTGLVYYKMDAIPGSTIGVMPEGVPADEIGYTKDWTFYGESVDGVVIPAAKLGNTYKIKIVQRDAYGSCTPDADATFLTQKIEAKTEVPDTPQNFKKYFNLSDGFNFSWDDVTNSDVDFYELRTNKNPGAASGLLARVQGTSAKVQFTAREGTVYLYAHNATSKYSYPATLTYGYPRLNAPAYITLEEAILSVNITTPDLIEGADGIKLYIENRAIDIKKATHYTYANQAGIYSVSACYYDVFGEGYMSKTYQATIKPYIDPKYIEDDSITLKMVDKTVKDAVADAQKAIPRLDKVDLAIIGLQQTDTELKNTIADDKKELASQIDQTASEIRTTVQSNRDAQDSVNDSLSNSISQVSQKADSISTTVQSNRDTQDSVNDSLSSKITQNADSITSIITNLGSSDKAKSAYSAISQLIDAINLRVKSEDYNGNEIISQINLAKGVQISGAYISIDGDTTFADNVIVNRMLGANSVTADKLSASIISLTNDQGIKGGSVLLDTSGLACTDSSGTTIKFGDNGMTSSDKNGNVFSVLSQFMIGSAQNGKYVKFNHAWQSIPSVIVIPQNIQVNNPSYSTSKIRLHCYAEDVTVDGFRMRAYSGIAEGSGFFAQYQECGYANWTIGRNNWAAQNKGLVYGEKTISFTVKMPSNASRVRFHGRWKTNLGYKYKNFVRFPNAASQKFVIKCNGTQTYSGMFFSDGGDNEIHGPTGVHGTDEYKSYVSNVFTVTGGYDLECALTLNPWTEHDGDGGDNLHVELLIDSLDVYVDDEQVLDDDGTGVFLVVNNTNGLYTITD